MGPPSASIFPEHHKFKMAPPAAELKAMTDAFEGIDRLAEGAPRTDGAPDFRRLPGFPLFGTGQTSIEGFEKCLEPVLKKYGDEKHIFWVNLRQEPVVYVNGIPTPPGMPQRSTSTSRSTTQRSAPPWKMILLMKSRSVEKTSSISRTSSVSTPRRELPMKNLLRSWPVSPPSMRSMQLSRTRFPSSSQSASP